MPSTAKSSALSALLTAAFFLPMGSGCKSRDRNQTSGGDSAVKALVAEPGSGGNYFLMFGQSGTGESFLQGTRKDIDNTPPYFGTKRIGFTTKSFYNPGYDSILSTTEQYAKAAGANGTLVWFFTGHGGSDGTLSINGEGLKFATVAQRIKRARNFAPLRRLIVIIDACYAGNMVDGEQVVANMNLTGASEPDVSPGTQEDLERLAETTGAAGSGDANMEDALMRNVLEGLGAAGGEEEAQGLQLGGSLFEELIVMASSTKYETSNDNGKYGGLFAAALQRVLGDINDAGGTDTIEGFLQKVNARVLHLNQFYKKAQHPKFQVVPPGIGKQSLLIGAAAGAAGGAMGGGNVPAADPGFKAYFDRAFTSDGGRRLVFRRDRKAEYYNTQGQRRNPTWNYLGNVIHVHFNEPDPWVFQVQSTCHLKLKLPNGGWADYKCQ